jgi:ABC-type Zn uptake system ZnuABC Zn-binding protein ZnuA
MDDQLVAAYREHKSYRKAAETLSRQTGVTITKDQVSRAVQRSGGVKVVASVDDSGSVVRTVASHRCDNKRIFPKNREPLEYQ